MSCASSADGSARVELSSLLRSRSVQAAAERLFWGFAGVWSSLAANGRGPLRRRQSGPGRGLGLSSSRHRQAITWLGPRCVVASWLTGEAGEGGGVVKAFLNSVKLLFESKVGSSGLINRCLTRRCSGPGAVASATCASSGGVCIRSNRVTPPAPTRPPSQRSSCRYVPRSRRAAERRGVRPLSRHGHY